MFEQYERHVAVTWHDGAMWVERLVSDKPITIDRAAAHYQAAHDFNEDRDSLEFVDAPERINLDECDGHNGHNDHNGISVTPNLDADPDVCPDGEDGKHEPDWASASAQWDGDELYVDVNCKLCGASGCIGTSATLAEGISW